MLSTATARRRADMGKRLKASWVNGKFMLRTSADEIAEKYPKAVQKSVDEALKEAFHGK